MIFYFNFKLLLEQLMSYEEIFMTFSSLNVQKKLNVICVTKNHQTFQKSINNSKRVKLVLKTASRLVITIIIHSIW